LKISDLARQVNLDESYLQRELRVLARHDLVETVKEGRERWSQITTAGGRALAEVPGGIQATLETDFDERSMRDAEEWAPIESIVHNFSPKVFSQVQQVGGTTVMLS